MTAAANIRSVPGQPGAISAVALVGRDRELAALVDAVNHPPSVAVVDGEAGIGKTRLADELRSRLRGGGRSVLVGACRQVSDPFPLFPVVEAVRLLREPLRGVALPAVTGALRPLVPELGVLLPPAPEPTTDRRTERHRVFRGLVEVLRAAGPVVLVLEDLHWADADTPDFLRYLLADPPAGLSLVLTYRDEEVAAAIRALPARLPTSMYRAHVRLAPLDAAATGALAAAILGADRVSAAFAGYLCERSSGLPFAIEELLALLRARGSMVYRQGAGWARRALDRLDVPAGIRDQVLERVSHLTPDTRAVLAAAAVLQTPVPPAVLAATCRLPPPRVWRAVEEALASGVLAESGDRVGFRHVLAAQAVYGAVPELRRGRLHARAADALRVLDPPPLGQVAAHLRRAGRTDEWVDAAERAADQAIALGHDAQAVRLLEEVLRDAPLTDDRAGRIAVTLARTFADAGGGEAVVDRLLAVLGRDLTGPVRGELSFRTAVAMDFGRSDLHRQRELCRVAVEHLEPDRHDLRAWALACLGIPLDIEVPLTEYRDWQRLALAELAKVSDPEVQLRLLGKVTMVQVTTGDRRWRELLARLDRIAATDPGTARRQYRVEAWALYAIGVEACYAGHHDLAAELVARASAYPASWEQPHRSASLLSARAFIDYCRGDWPGLLPRVERLIDELADYVPARTEVELVAGCLRLARGDLTDARDRLATLATGGSLGLSHGGLGAAAALRLALAGGDPAGAAALVRRQVATIRRRGFWAPIGRCLPVMTEALVAAGDLPGARNLLTEAAAELRSLDAPLAGAALRHSRGLLAAARRRWRQATADLLAAAAEYERLNCPYEAAQARERAAGCQFPGGDPAAGESLRAALATYQRLGARWDVDRAARSARQYGVARPARHRRGRHGYGDQLSPREHEVARLVAAGRTNQEIAGLLYLSVSTVEKHVAAVVRKLEAGSRRQVRELMPTEPVGR